MNYDLEEFIQKHPDSSLAKLPTNSFEYKLMSLAGEFMGDIKTGDPNIPHIIYSIINPCTLLTLSLLGTMTTDTEAIKEAWLLIYQNGLVSIKNAKQMKEERRTK